MLRACYFVFYRMLALVAAVRLPVDAGDFALLSRRVVDALKQFPNISGICADCEPGWGFDRPVWRWNAPHVMQAARSTARWRLVKLALDGLLSFSMALVPRGGSRTARHRELSAVCSLRRLRRAHRRTHA